MLVKPARVSGPADRVPDESNIAPGATYIHLRPLSRLLGLAVSARADCPYSLAMSVDEGSRAMLDPGERPHWTQAGRKIG